jgi:hypothetical protein
VKRKQGRSASEEVYLAATVAKEQDNMTRGATNRQRNGDICVQIFSNDFLCYMNLTQKDPLNYCPHELAILQGDCKQKKKHM